MPYKKQHPCSWHGCTDLTRETYCQVHNRIVAEKREERRKATDRVYNGRRNKDKCYYFYHSKEWQEARMQVLIRDSGLCKDCSKRGIATVATEIHHIIMLSEDWNKRLDLENLVSLCHQCHNIRHNR